MPKKVEVFYLKQNESYSNGYKPVLQKWEAMKNVAEAEYWLYTGAQRGVVFGYEVNNLSIPEEDIAAWKDKGYIVRDV